MPTQEVFATGDQIGIYGSLSMSGNSNGVKVVLHDVQTLGTSSDVFRIVIRQVSNGQDDFTNGQFVDIYPWPDTDPPSGPIYSSLNPQHDQFQGRASSSDHQIFTSSNVVFDVNGIVPGTVQYGPGLHPLRSEQLPFDAFPSEPPLVICFTAGTRIRMADGGEARVETLRPGDLVWTLDHGPQPLRWRGSRTVARSTSDHRSQVSCSTSSASAAEPSIS